MKPPPDALHYGKPQLHGTMTSEQLGDVWASDVYNARLALHNNRYGDGEIGTSEGKLRLQDRT